MCFPLYRKCLAQGPKRHFGKIEKLVTLANLDFSASINTIDYLIIVNSLYIKIENRGDAL